jgi:NAD(P)-dependent dehydrogenase (short-subunit alcohol dehydrogenase family)
VTQGALSSAGCGALWGSWTGKRRRCSRPGVGGQLTGTRARARCDRIGVAIAGRFERDGALVVITGRDCALGEWAGQELGPGRPVRSRGRRDLDAVAASVHAAVDHLGGLDVLVNNAGAGVTARLAGTSLAGYDQVMNVKVRGCLLYAQHSYPHLARRSGA